LFAKGYHVGKQKQKDWRNPMKTISDPSVISPTILVLAALAGAVLFVILKGIKVPLLSRW
jgi:hypothetical protein